MLRQRIEVGGPLFLILRCEGVEIGLQRRLGVHRDGFAAGQAYHGVGPEHPALALQAGLLVEIDMLHHVRHFEHIPQLALAPPARSRRSAQRLHKAAGLVPQRRLACNKGLHLLGNPAIGFLARLLQFLRALLDLLQLLADRLDERGDGLLARLQVLLRLDLVRPEAFADQAQEGVAVLAERFGGERGKPAFGLAARPVDLLQTRSMGPAFRFEACLGLLRPAARRRGEDEPDQRRARERAKGGQPDFHNLSRLSRKPG